MNKNLELFCEYMLIKDDENNYLIEVNFHQDKMSILSMYVCIRQEMIFLILTATYVIPYSDRHFY